MYVQKMKMEWQPVQTLLSLLCINTVCPDDKNFGSLCFGKKLWSFQDFGLSSFPVQNYVKA